MTDRSPLADAIMRPLPAMGRGSDAGRDLLTRCWRRKAKQSTGATFEEPRCNYAASPDPHDLGQCAYHAEELRRSMNTPDTEERLSGETEDKDDA